jgi:hypothetical protein
MTCKPAWARERLAIFGRENRDLRAKFALFREGAAVATQWGGQ